MAAPAPTPAAGEAAIAPPPPGMLTMPPRIPSAQAVIDRIDGTVATNELVFFRYLRAFNEAARSQLTPLQFMWQQGEFIRLALEHGRLTSANRVAELMLGSLAHTGIDRHAVEHAAATHSIGGVNLLLLLAYYVPLCPDLGASLDLFKLAVRVVVQQNQAPVPPLHLGDHHRYWNVCLDPGWLATVPFLAGGRFYVYSQTDWFHVMRRDHIHAVVAWLTGPEQPLQPIPSVHSFTAHQLLQLPDAVGALFSDATLHTQPRADLVQLRKQMAHYTGRAAADRALDAIDQYTWMHAPSTMRDTVPARQAQVMDDLVEQMMRASTADVPFELAGLVMDYVRRDESVQADGSKLTPYKQTENDYLRTRIGVMGALIAEEQVAGAPARPAAAAARPRPDDAEEKGQQQHRARLSARFSVAAPLARW